MTTTTPVYSAELVAVGEPLVTSSERVALARFLAW